MKISVAVRTKFHAFQLAQQLQNRGVLHKLYTSFYGKILNKDNRIGFDIPLHKISQNLITALLFYGFDTQKYSVFQYFGRCVAKQLRDENLIVTFPIIALPILERAKSLGIKTVISHASAHTVAHGKLLLEGNQKLGLSTKQIEQTFHAIRQESMQMEYEKADFIQVPSLFVKRTFLEQGIPENKLLYVPLGVDLRFFYRKSINPPKKFRLIYVGQLSIQKGLPLLLAAFNQLNLSDSELYLIGASTEELNPFLKRYGKNIICIGVVPQIKLIEYLNNSSVFIINSIQDGFAQVVPQAMSCGLPVICTENVGGADLVENGKTGFVIPIHDLQALQEKILYFYENPEEIIIMGRAAQQKVQQNYTWDIFGQKCFNDYAKILQ